MIWPIGAIEDDHSPSALVDQLVGAVAGSGLHVVAQAAVDVGLDVLGSEGFGIAAR